MRVEKGVVFVESRRGNFTGINFEMEEGQSATKKELKELFRKKFKRALSIEIVALKKGA